MLPKLTAVFRGDRQRYYLYYSSFREQWTFKWDFDKPVYAQEPSETKRWKWSNTIREAMFNITAYKHELHQGVSISSKNRDFLGFEINGEMITDLQFLKII